MAELGIMSCKENIIIFSADKYSSEIFIVAAEAEDKKGGAAQRLVRCEGIYSFNVLRVGGSDICVTILTEMLDDYCNTYQNNSCDNKSK